MSHQSVTGKFPTLDRLLTAYIRSTDGAEMIEVTGGPKPVPKRGSHRYVSRKALGQLGYGRDYGRT
jgi:hypothetical protein